MNDGNEKIKELEDVITNTELCIFDDRMDYRNNVISWTEYCKKNKLSMKIITESRKELEGLKIMLDF